jgi:ethanolamine ammonia-lyase small subunit
LGRKLDDASRTRIANDCPHNVDFQVILGDGLSAAAVVKQVPQLLPLLQAEAAKHGWKVGRPFLVRHCRVGVFNDVGEILSASVVVLLIGERPGLMTAESLSAYMAFQPKAGHTDADRNLISNIHARGVPIEQSAQRIIALAEQMRTMNISGVSVKEQLSEKNNRGTSAAAISTTSE